jgi:hypothetical protein
MPNKIAYAPMTQISASAPAPGATRTTKPKIADRRPTRTKSHAFSTCLRSWIALDDLGDASQERRDADEHDIGPCRNRTEDIDSFLFWRLYPVDRRPRDPQRIGAIANGVAHGSAPERTDQHICPGIDLRDRCPRHGDPNIAPAADDVAAIAGKASFDRREQFPCFAINALNVPSP